jgi:hypothetical protein
MSAPAKTVLQHLHELDGHLAYLDAVLNSLILRCECLEARLADFAKKRIPLIPDGEMRRWKS